MNVIETTRSFFGVHRVVETSDRHASPSCCHGTTIHGAERVRDADGTPVAGTAGTADLLLFRRPDLRGHRGGRARAQGGLEERRGGRARRRQPRLPRETDGESWTFFEIDPEVVRLARDPSLFRFLSACAPSAPIVLGDARLTLAASPQQFDLIVLDAFSSDAIPVHLLTREALRGLSGAA